MEERMYIDDLPQDYVAELVKNLEAKCEYGKWYVIRDDRPDKLNFIRVLKWLIDCREPWIFSNDYTRFRREHPEPVNGYKEYPPLSEIDFEGKRVEIVVEEYRGFGNRLMKTKTKHVYHGDRLIAIESAK